MKERASQSTLQNNILLYMESGRFESLTELADKLNAHRSSVSRAIHALLDRNLVSKVGQKWDLTTEGRNELSVLRNQLSERAAKTSKTATRLIEQGALAALSLSPPSTVFPDISALVSATVRKPDASILSAVQKLTDSVTGLDSLTWVRNSIQPMLDAAVRVDLTSAAQGALRHMEDLERTRDAYFQGLPAVLFQEDYRVSAREAVKPLLDAAERFDAATMIREAMKPILNAPDYSQALSHAFADSALMDSLKSPFLAASMDAIASAALKPSLAEIMGEQAWRVIAGNSHPAMVDICSQLSKEAFSSLTQSQRLNLASIEQLSLYGKETFPLLEELNAANVGLSRMIHDLGDIRMRDFASDARIFSAAAQLPDVAAVTRTYKGYLADVIGKFGAEVTHASWNVELALPTRTTSTYIRSVNFSLMQVDEDGPEFLPDADRSGFLDRPGQLDPIFEELGPNFAAMWHGSWSTLQQNGSDHIRQAAHSGRELLMQCLAYYAPDSCFSEAEIRQDGQGRKVTRRMRVRRILQHSGNSAIQWVDAVAKALDETYDSLVSASHYRDVNPNITEQQLAGLLHTLGGLLSFIEGSRRKP